MKLRELIDNLEKFSDNGQNDNVEVIVGDYEENVNSSILCVASYDSATKDRDVIYIKIEIGNGK